MAKHQADFYLDITTDICPMTFVKTKLLIEKMQPGEIVEVRLTGEEPLSNVPRSVIELGHFVLSDTPEDGDRSIHRLMIEKR